MNDNDLPAGQRKDYILDTLASSIHSIINGRQNIQDGKFYIWGGAMHEIGLTETECLKTITRALRLEFALSHAPDVAGREE